VLTNDHNPINRFVPYDVASGIKEDNADRIDLLDLQL